ncbi:hypothetical protein [Corynebacterium kalidii]|uniref:Uncharacterized protein n=1 Tax=Corynebacterium kalidii TaxID=2931982 RepID=A0A9X1WFH5_9CORY|nr:hypothetical protein [Corynebacterium kalidii]MCJ7857198.1 hypothetical protein [Corynebacterium kalidii]
MSSARDSAIKTTLRALCIIIPTLGTLSLFHLDANRKILTIALCYFLFLFVMIIPGAFTPNASPVSFVSKRNLPDGGVRLKGYLIHIFALWLILFEIILIMLAFGIGTDSRRWYTVVTCSVLYIPVILWIIRLLIREKSLAVTLEIRRENLSILTMKDRHIETKFIKEINVNDRLIKPTISIISREDCDAKDVDAAAFAPFLPIGTRNLESLLIQTLRPVPDVMKR